MNTATTETGAPSAPASPAVDHNADAQPMQAPSLPPPESEAPAPAAAPAAAPATVALDDIFSTHIGTMPGFDPAIHAVDKDGNPRRRGDGSFALKRGRKPGQSPSGKPRAPGEGLPPAAPSASVPDPVNNEIEQAARTATNLVIGTSVMLFGEDFVPENKQEPLTMQSAFRDYFAERGVTKLPPEIALAAALAGYALPRFTKPKARDRIGVLKVGISKFFARFKKPRRGDVTETDKEKAE